MVFCRGPRASDGVVLDLTLSRLAPNALLGEASIRRPHEDCGRRSKNVSGSLLDFYDARGRLAAFRMAARLRARLPSRTQITVGRGFSYVLIPVMPEAEYLIHMAFSAKIKRGEYCEDTEREIVHQQSHEY